MDIRGKVGWRDGEVERAVVGGHADNLEGGYIRRKGGS